MAKEWEGPNGYCNCLFVTMARTSLREVTISEGQVVPHLEKLADEFPETRDWLREQEFNYGAIRADQVIPIVCEWARIKRGPLGAKAGDVVAIDMVGDTGPPKQRTFHCVLERSGGFASLTISLLK